MMSCDDFCKNARSFASVAFMVEPSPRWAAVDLIARRTLGDESRTDAFTGLPIQDARTGQVQWWVFKGPDSIAPLISEGCEPVQRAREIKAGFRRFRRRWDRRPSLSPQRRERPTPPRRGRRGFTWVSL